ncbi:polynucleotide 5'-hydroxyl-kinase NOL9 [Phlebotomus papatasi]|uniref:polynucleotide 5'-hydroxyl-kinase NOL9 n=1 Tax=Phlebotomus papatasi TaxID=29031 RepID=UPI00248469E2|nr:polynucleotide 5'-hydroxyl-kinase NOL9 [Phlebotomus papatasi]
MGKKKNKNQALGMGNKSPTAKAKKAGKNKVKNGFGQKKGKFESSPGISGVSGVSEGKPSQEFSKKKQRKKLKKEKQNQTNQMPKKPVPEGVNGTGSKDSKDTLAGSMKRQKKEGLKGPKPKKIKKKATQPGQFVKANISPEKEVERLPEKVQKKKKKKGKTGKGEKGQKSLEIAVCEDVSKENLGDSDNCFDDPYQRFLGTFLDSSGDDYSQYSSSDDYDSFSDEEIDEEFSTDTDFSENEEEESLYSDDSEDLEDSSDDDVEYFPGDQYDDVILRKGEAKYREIPKSVQFSDEAVSEIIEYFSDEGEIRKEGQPQKTVDQSLDTSKAVIQAGSVQLDGKPAKKKPEASKMKKVVCSKNCSHEHIPCPKKSSKESPLNSLKFKETEEVTNIEASMEVDKEDAGKPEEDTEEIPDLEASDLRDEDDSQEDVKFYNAIDSYHVLLHLKETISFHGNLSIKLVAGAASILEYTLDLNERVTANAPIGYSSVNITPKPSNPEEYWRKSLEKDNKYLKEIFFESDLKEIEENLKPSQAVLLLNKITNNRVKMVEKYSANRVFPNMITYRKPRPFASSEFILQCRFSSSSRNNFQVNPKWQEISVDENSRIMTIGGKNVGKSSLIRHQINKNLKKFGKILLIDLDIGQPEISLPQTVSATLLDRPILGMACFMEQQPETSRLFGDLNVANDPAKYYNSVLDLQQDISSKEEFQSIPWFINTMGYAKGIGMELMIALIGLFKPSQILQIDHEIQLENFECEFSKKLVDDWEWQLLDNVSLPSRECSDFKVLRFPTMVSGSLSDDIRRSKASETRQISILAHLGGALGDDCDWITQSQPVCVPLDKITLLNLTDEDIDEQHKWDLINGNLVYLCNNSFENPKVFGLGIVRGIDNALQSLYLLPTTRQNLNQVNSLAVCAITLPPQLILNQSSSVQGELPYVYNTDEAIGSRNVVGRAFRDEKAIANMYSKNTIE